MKEGGYPHMYITCKEVMKTSMPEVFSTSAMLSYFIEYKQWDKGLRYIKGLGLEEDKRNKLIRAFKSYEKAC